MKSESDGTTVEVQVVEGFSVTVAGKPYGGGAVAGVLATDAARWSRRGWVKPAPRKSAPRKRM